MTYDPVTYDRQWRDTMARERAAHLDFHTSVLPAWQSKRPKRASPVVKSVDRITRDHLELAASLGRQCRTAAKMGPEQRRLHCRYSDVAVSTQAELAGGSTLDFPYGRRLGPSSGQSNDCMVEWGGAPRSAWGSWADASIISASPHMCEGWDTRHKQNLNRRRQVPSLGFLLPEPSVQDAKAYADHMTRPFVPRA